MNGQHSKDRTAFRLKVGENEVEELRRLSMQSQPSSVFPLCTVICSTRRLFTKYVQEIHSEGNLLNYE